MCNYCRAIIRRAIIRRAIIRRAIILGIGSLLILLSGWLSFSGPSYAQDMSEASSFADPNRTQSLRNFSETVQQNELIWRSEINSACISTDHHYTLDIPFDPMQLNDIRFSMANYDVDYNRPCEDSALPGGPEVDKAYINSSYLGILTGADDAWSVNSWPLANTQLVSGTNEILVDTDSTATGCWCVGVGWIEVRAKPKFTLLHHSPTEDEQHRHFKREKLHLTVEFSDAYDPATVTEATFQLAYRNEQGIWVQVTDGTFQQVDAKTVEYMPAADLLDGVRYQVIVRAGIQGVKSIDGFDLEAGAVWYFWTAPDLSVTDNFIYADGAGTRCPPAGAPCAGLELAVFQTARNARVVLDKPAIGRLYFRWRRHATVFEDDQVKQMDVRVTLTLGSQTVAVNQLVKRPDEYTQAEISAAQHTVNINHTPTGTAGNLDYMISVEPSPQKNQELLRYETAKSLTSVGPGETLRVPRYWVRDGDHDGGIPPAFVATTDALVTGAELLTTDEFPVLSTSLFAAGYMDIGYTRRGIPTTNIPNCAGTSQQVACPFYEGVPDMSEMECVALHLRDRQYGRPLLMAFPPQSVCPAGIRGYYASPLILIFPTAATDTIAHELAHAQQLPDVYTDTITTLSQSLEGYHLRTNTNYSFVEQPTLNPPIIMPLMASGRSAAAGYWRWIHNQHYDNLINRFYPLPLVRGASANADEYLIINGWVDGESETGIVAPLYHQPVPNTLPLATGPCVANLLNSGGEIIVQGFFAPGLEDAHLPGVVPPDEEPHHEHADTHGGFSISLPWDNNAIRLQILCEDTLLATVERSFDLPQADFVGLAEESILRGMTTINWAGSDPGGQSLYYQLLFDAADGRGMFALTGIQSDSSFEIDTTQLSSGEHQQLRLVVTDGFNTTWAIRDVSIQNPLQVVGTWPADGDSEVGLSTALQATFVSQLRRSTVEEDTFLVSPVLTVTTSAKGAPIAGRITVDADRRTATFTPDRLLHSNTTYQATLTDGIEDRLGNSLGSDVTWIFTTAADTASPIVDQLFPRAGEPSVPRNSGIQVEFNEVLDTTSITPDALQLADESDNAFETVLDQKIVDGRHIIQLRPNADLAAERAYQIIVQPTVRDLAGNQLAKQVRSTFTTGSAVSTALHILGYREEANDTDDDERYESLTIWVEAEIVQAGDYALSGSLLGQIGELVTWSAVSTTTLDVGVHRLGLVFDGVDIRNLGGDGPYTLHALHLYDTSRLDRYLFVEDAYRTHAYQASDFHSDLTLAGLPNQVLRPGASREDAFNLRDFTHHEYLSVDDVTYRLFFNSEPKISVLIDPTDHIDILPATAERGESEIWIEARDVDGHRILSRFTVRIQDFDSNIFMPLIQR